MKKLFKLTRSVGSVTLIMIQIQNWRKISTHTLRGERDLLFWDVFIHSKISTHTLRGERDISAVLYRRYKRNFNSHAPWGAWPVLDSSLIQFKAFQLTRSVGSVTNYSFFSDMVYPYFNSHAPWGAWLNTSVKFIVVDVFQLTRSVGSVTIKQIIQQAIINISTHTLRGERDRIWGRKW